MGRATLKLGFMLALGLIVGMSGRTEADMVVGGITFEDDAFADSLISSSGVFTVGGAASLAAALTDLDPGSYAFSSSSGAYVQLGFVDNVAVNGAGADIALFELGIPDTFIFSLTIGGTTISYGTSATGDTAGGFALNVATIDLSDFGLAAGSTVSSIVIGMSTVTPGSGTVPSLSMVGAINSRSASVSAVPEPSTLAGGLLVVLTGGSLLARRRRITA